MQAKELYFVIPTYRLREVGATVEQYDEHFWRNGHSVRMIVIDAGTNALLRHQQGWGKVGVWPAFRPVSCQ